MPAGGLFEKNRTHFVTCPPNEQGLRASFRNNRNVKNANHVNNDK